MPAIESPLRPSEISDPVPEGLNRGLVTPVRKWVVVFASAGLIVIAGLGVWRYLGANPAAAFQLASVERGRMESIISSTGTCNAVVTVQVGSQVSGNIKALYADFNTHVKAGQLVALIDPEIFEARVQQAEATVQNSGAALENAKANVQKADADIASARATEASQVAAVAKAKVAMADAKTKLARRVAMVSSQIISQEDMDTAQATYDEAAAELEAAQAQREAAIHSVQASQAAYQASLTQLGMIQAQVRLNQAALDQARIDLNHTRITAPLDGTVVSRNMDVGQTVAASFQAPTVFLIAQDLTKMQVDTNVDEADVGRVKLGQHASFTVDAFPGTVFQGLVTQIREAPINVQNVITYDTVIEVANPDLKLFPGMTANVSILTDRRANALKVPNASLRFKPPESVTATGSKGDRQAGGNWRTVYVNGQDGKAHAVPVEIGISDGNFAEVTQGDLHEGQQVIVSVLSKGPAPATPAPSMPKRF